MIPNVAKKIYLVWKPAAHEGRYVVGQLVERSIDSYEFNYLFNSELENAKRRGFPGYPAFPIKEGIFSENVIQFFKVRLPSRSREDFKSLLKYWNISNSEISDFDLLAITGGRLATDHFEFIDPHVTKRPDEFLTDLAGFRYHSDEKLIRSLKPESSLKLLPEPDNHHDKHAVQVFYGEKKLGYIKRIQAETIFNDIQNRKSITASVWNVDANGIINSVLIKVIISQ